ncbi:MAG: hypothetical protein EOM07_11240 [Clostridia bacterium]|nr:hypothetical protein [Clostridia bacterium]
MAQVTMELRTVLSMENFNLFDFNYECDDAAWKEKLEQQFINTYYFMEIGQETIDRWKHRVRTKFQSIMPYYNDLYKSTLMEINPLITHNRKETYAADNSSNTSMSAVNDAIEYDHPQTGTSSDIPASRMNNDGTSTSTNTTLNNYERNIEGLDGDQSVLLKAYRETIIDINEMIMKDCKDLFILVY